MPGFENTLELTRKKIASHTWTHPDLTTLNDTAIYNELKKTEEAIENIIGLRPAYMRPPYGAYNSNVTAVAASLNEDVVISNFDSHDWEFPANESIALYDAFIATNPTTVLALNHETYNTSAHVVLPHALELLKGKGYKLVTVAECLGGQPYLKPRWRWPVNPTKLKCI
ncbi:Carbohydrate esterase 4 protein [Serendipita sp. 400]|nr:Carbohydrate esterase 4 protein [Serendipita sp. 400]